MNRAGDYVTANPRKAVQAAERILWAWTGIVTLIPTTSDTGNFQSHMEARPHEPIAAISDFKGKLLRFITRTVNMTVPG
jgi:hypothetical protein